MFRAVWNGAVLAESDRTVKVEGNHYFPPEALHREYFTDSATISTCPWKGQARYYNVRVDGETNRDAAWYYAQPRPGASSIAGHVAFWNGVRVERVLRPGEETPGGRQPGTVAAERTRHASWLVRAAGFLRRRRPGQQCTGCGATKAANP